MTTAAATPSHRPRILVVDDIEANRCLLEFILSRDGFDLDLAPGGTEAIRLAGCRRYDAILMDLQMPDLDGYTTARRIRASEPSGQHTPIIALTAAPDHGTRKKCLAAGMDEQLTKPLDLKLFKTLLAGFSETQVASSSQPRSRTASVTA